MLVFSSGRILLFKLVTSVFLITYITNSIRIMFFNFFLPLRPFCGLPICYFIFTYFFSFGKFIKKLKPIL